MLQKMCENTATLDEILEASQLQEVHCVHVHFSEQRRGDSDDWRDEDVPRLTELAQVTGSDKPGDVGGEMRPPKSIDYVGSCCKVAMMPSSVVGSGEDHRSFIWYDDDLVIPLWISPPKVAVLQEEVGGVAGKCSTSFLGQVRWLAQGNEPIADVSQTLVRFARLIGSGEGVVGQRSGSHGISEGTVIVDGFRCKSCA